MYIPLVAFQLIIDSPVSPATSIAPLVFVVTVTAIKQVRINPGVTIKIRFT